MLADLDRSVIVLAREAKTRTSRDGEEPRPAKGEIDNARACLNGLQAGLADVAAAAVVLGAALVPERSLAGARRIACALERLGRSTDLTKINIAEAARAVVRDAALQGAAGHRLVLSGAQDPVSGLARKSASSAGAPVAFLAAGGRGAVDESLSRVEAAGGVLSAVAKGQYAELIPAAQAAVAGELGMGREAVAVPVTIDMQAFGMTPAGGARVLRWLETAVRRGLDDAATNPQLPKASVRELSRIAHSEVEAWFDREDRRQAVKRLGPGL